jgi:hypothetical protein
VVDLKSAEHQAELSSASYQVLLACAYFSIIAIWSLGIAFNGAPDESTHFFLLEYIDTFHTLPNTAEPTQAFTGLISGHTWQPGDFWYHGLPFPHVVGALISSYSLGWIFPNDLSYLAARSFNWFLGGVFICALFRIAHTAGMSRKTSALTAIAICTIPQVSFVFSYFNSDAYGLVSVALLLSSLLGFLKNPTKRSVAFLGGSLGLMFLAKLYLLPALVFVLVMLAANQYRTKSFSGKRAALLLGTALVVSAPLLLLTWLKYGEISGISGQVDFVAMHKNNPAAGYGTCYLGCPGHLINLQTFEPWLGLTLLSYFSVTGWMNIFIPPHYYLIAGSLLALLLVMAVTNAKRSYLSITREAFFLTKLLPLIMVLGLFPSIIILSLIASQNSLPQPQGRYLFVTIPFIALLVAMATEQNVFDSTQGTVLKTSRSENISGGILIVVVAFMVWTNAVSWSANTFSATSFRKSALGSGIITILEKSGIPVDSVPTILDAAQFADRILINGNAIYVKVLPPTSAALASVDEAKWTSDGFYLRGWSFLENTNGTPQYLIAVKDQKVMGALKIERKRPDVAMALNARSALLSGYEGSIHGVPFSKDCDVKLYTVSSTLKIFSMPDVCAPLSHSSH